MAWHIQSGAPMPAVLTTCLSELAQDFGYPALRAHIGIVNVLPSLGATESFRRARFHVDQTKKIQQ